MERKTATGDLSLSILKTAKLLISLFCLGLQEVKVDSLHFASQSSEPCGALGWWIRLAPYPQPRAWICGRWATPTVGVLRTVYG